MDRETIMELRRLRLDAQYHNAKAAEYMARATNGTSTRRATNMSGTGKCPVSDYAVAYGREHAAAIVSANAANAIWARVHPLLAAYAYDTQCVIELYYNQGADMQDVARAVKRSLKACEKMQAHVCLTLKMEERNAD